MTDGELNSAEVEAERILEAEFSKARAEECPEGDQCPIHFRVDSEMISEPAKYARLVNYHGEYVVVTEDNHELDNPVMMLKILLGKVSRDDLPPRWETSIYHVGEGTIGDLSDANTDIRRSSLRYAVQHDDWSEVKKLHDVTVSLLRQDMIDVSKPVGEI